MFEFDYRELEYRYAKELKQTLARAEGFAREYGHPYIGTHHLLLGLLTSDDKGVARFLLQRRGITFENAVNSIQPIFDYKRLAPESVKYSPQAQRALLTANDECLRANADKINNYHLLQALWKGKGLARDMSKGLRNPNPPSLS